MSFIVGLKSISFFAALTLLVVTGCSSSSADDGGAESTSAISAQRCMKNEDCGAGHVCTTQSRGDCDLQGDVCTGICAPVSR